MFEIAHKGTIFLDEISEMDMQGQTRLLRVLEERCVMRIGDDKVIPVDVRVVTASNKNLLRLVKEGKFREDLYYRLNVLTLNIPPLREREEDVILIANAYINKYGEEYKKHIVLSDSANKELMNFSWEGNVRQLRNFCERLVIVADEIEIAGCDIREQLAVMGMAIFERAIETEKEITENVRDITESVNNIKTAERISICNALRKANGNRECASKMLGISKSTLWRKMKESEISEKY